MTWARGLTVRLFICVLCATALAIESFARPASAFDPKQSLTQTELLRGYARSVAITDDGTVVVAIFNRVFALKNGTRSLIAGAGPQGDSIVEGDAKGSRLFEPGGVAVAPDGSTVIADTGNNRVLRVKDNAVTFIAGCRGGVKGKTFDPQDATKTCLNSPKGIAVSADGTVLIADSLNNRVLGVSDNKPTLIAGGEGSHKDKDPLRIRFNSPESVAISTDGAILIADTWNERLFSVKDGEVKRIMRSEHLSRPRAVTVANDGTLLVTAFDRVLAVQNGEVTLIAGDRPFCPGVKTAYVPNTTGIAVASDGSILIADYFGLKLLSPKDDLQIKLKDLVATGKRLAKRNPREGDKNYVELQHVITELVQYMDGVGLVTTSDVEQSLKRERARAALNELRRKLDGKKIPLPLTSLLRTDDPIMFRG